MSDRSEAQFRVVGRPIPGRDAEDKVTGRARYTTDLAVPGMAHARLVGSPYAHADVEGFDLAAARAVPGVLGILTRDDLADLDPYYGQAIRDQPILAVDRVRYEGEPVAAVAAEDPGTAERAAGLVAIRYRERPAVLSVDEALAADAPLLHDARGAAGTFPDVKDVAPVPGTNICYHYRYGFGDVRQGFAEADRIFEHTFSLPAVHHYALEPHAAIARVGRDGITVWAGTQYPFATRRLLAEMFHEPLHRVRVIVPATGGAFGGREIMGVVPLAVVLARKVGRPVRLALTVEETFTTIRRHAARCHVKTGVTRDGRLVARTVRLYYDTGAYADQGPRVARKGGYRAKGPYRLPHYEVDAYAVYTNTVPAGAYRGFGTPQVAWAYESQMDLIARALGRDPVAFRLQNLVERGEAFSPANRPLDGDMPGGLRRLAAALGWDRAKPTGHGRGVAVAVKDGGGTKTSATAIVRLHQDGTATLLVSAVDSGQGARTVLAQIVAEALALPVDRVALAPVDTAITPFDQRTNASRATTLVGLAAYAAAQDVVAQLRAAAAERLGVAASDLRLEEGAVVAGARRVGYGEVIQHFFREAGGELIGRGYYRPDPEEGPVGGQASFWEIGMGGAEVAVDRETGELRIARYVSLADAGRAINPVMAEAQDLGAAVMGLGPALFERLEWEGGQLVNSTLMEYRVPLFTDMPAVFEGILVENGDGPGPYGAKGIGEGGIIAVAPALANALEDAAGVRLTDLPMTPEAVWRALRAASPDLPPTTPAPVPPPGESPV